jgi:hypothetical protein
VGDRVAWGDELGTVTNPNPAYPGDVHIIFDDGITGTHPPHNVRHVEAQGEALSEGDAKNLEYVANEMVASDGWGDFPKTLRETASRIRTTLANGAGEDVRTLFARVVELRDRNGALEGEVERLRTQLTRQQREAVMYATALGETEVERDRLRAELDEARRERDEAREKLADAEATRNALSRRVGDWLNWVERIGVHHWCGDGDARAAIDAKLAAAKAPEFTAADARKLREIAGLLSGCLGNRGFLELVASRIEEYA